MSQIINNIKAYINAYKNSYTKIKVMHVKDNIDYTLIYYDYYDHDISIMVYNETFIKINVDKNIHAICDGIKSVRYELDKIHTNKHYAANC